MTTTLSPIEQARFNMIEQQIRPWNVLDTRILQLLGELKREDFVPSGHKNLAFGDFELPLTTSGATKGEAMLSPKVEARMVQDLQLTGSESVLEIGTGSGYTAALMGRLVKHVTTLEINPELADLAKQNLSRAVVANVDVRVADGSKMAQIETHTSGQFDVIVLSGSVANIPEALKAKLKLGGRLAAIVGNEPIMRFNLITRTADGFLTTQPWDAVAPRLAGFAEDDKFNF
jgi:protein-L-isoaspartate(D-aspartate) O-methyltransferase